MKTSTNLTINDVINNLKMEIMCINHVKLGKEWKTKKCYKSSYTRIYFVTKGEGVIVCNGEKITLKENNIYIIPAETNFEYSCEDYLEKLYCHIRLCGLEGLDIISQLSKCIVLNNRKEIIEKIIDEHNSIGINNAINIKSILYSIVAEAVNSGRLGEVKNYSNLVKSTIDYIELHLSANLSTEKIADSLFVSSSKLQKQFKMETGISIGKYINSRLLVKAETMLKYSENSIKQISDELGFCDQFYFSRVFAKHYGVSPKKYRVNTF